MRIVILPLAVLVALTAGIAAQTPPRFRFERDVQVAGPGANRLAVDVALLVGARPGLGDLRFFDPAGREVGYLLISPPPVTPVWLAGLVSPVASVKTETLETSGFEANLQEATRIDRIRVLGIGAPFLKRGVLEGSGDRQRWTLLQPEVTLFDLPEERLTRLELAFPPGEYQYVRLIWNDTNSGRVNLPARVEGRRARGSEPAVPSLTASLEFTERPNEPRRSRYRVQLPGAQLPIAAIAIEADAPYIMRPAQVLQAGFDGQQVQPTAIGHSVLKRVTRNGVQADELTLALSPAPRESQLELVIDNGDNDPLPIRAITAIFADLPTIYFETGETRLIARYGDPRLSAPRYDLEAARASLRLDAAAMSSWGDARAITTDAAPLETPLPSVGASLDASTFQFSRELSGATGGLAAVPLDAAVLAHSRGITDAFADVRIVNAAGAQIPYVVERLDEPLLLNLALQPGAQPPSGASARAGESWYRLDLPYERLPDARLVLETSARVFRRHLQLMRAGTMQADRRSREPQVVARLEWAHANADVQAPPLTLTVPAQADRELFVVVAEGDNTSLPLTRAQLLLPSYRVRFFWPANDTLRLVYGHRELARPQYDLALLAPQVLGAAATEVMATSEQRSTNVAGATDNVIPLWVFWGVLSLATLALLGIIVRLVRTAAPDASSVG